MDFEHIHQMHITWQQKLITWQQKLNACELRAGQRKNCPISWRQIRSLNFRNKSSSVHTTCSDVRSKSRSRRGTRAREGAQKRCGHARLVACLREMHFAETPLRSTRAGYCDWLDMLWLVIVTDLFVLHPDTVIDLCLLHLCVPIYYLCCILVRWLTCICCTLCDDLLLRLWLDMTIYLCCEVI